MKFYTYGNHTNPVMLLFPGTGCHHKTFDYVVPYLQDHFYVVVTSYDGFDETENTIFPDMITETEKIEEYVKENFNGKVFAAYGCSLGGSFVGLLIQRKNIHIDHGFIGSSDLDQASIAVAKGESAIVAPIFHHIMQSGKLPSFLSKQIDKGTEQEKKYINDFLRFFGVGEGAMDMSFVSKKSIYNQFYSDLITPLEDSIDVEGTTIHVFYALKMGEEYEKRYLQHFKNPDIRRHNLQHEELLVALPEQWTKEILDCCGMEGGQAFISPQDHKKVLVYGAGVIGCFLAHVLMKEGHEVTLLARGEWKDNLETNGMRIHHILQRSRTVDFPLIINEIADEEYDVVFVTMQQNQILEIASELGKIHAPYIVCVGNNLRATEVQNEILSQNAYPKKVLFGFQGTSGCRKDNIVECLHASKGSMSIGALGKEVDAEDKDFLNSLFKKSGYKLDWQNDMDSWLWCHMAFILPMIYVAYKEKCNLRTMSAKQMDQVMEATREGFELLKMSGYQILPKGEEDYYIPKSAKRKFTTDFMLLIGKTKFGDYTVTDHCRHAAYEMHEAQKAWDALREKHREYEMPAWDGLKQEMPDWTELEETYGKGVNQPVYKRTISKKRIVGTVAAVGTTVAITAVLVKKMKRK